MDRVSASLLHRPGTEPTAKTSEVNGEAADTPPNGDNDPVAVWSPTPKAPAQRSSFRKMRMQTLAAPRLFRFVNVSPLAQATWWQLWSSGGELKRFKDGRAGVALWGSLTYAKQIADRVGRSERQVRRALDELEEAGMLSRHRIIRGYAYRMMIPDQLAAELMQQLDDESKRRTVKTAEVAEADDQIETIDGPDPDRDAKCRHLQTLFSPKTAETLADVAIVRATPLDRLSFAIQKATKSKAENPAGLLRSWINKGDIPGPKRSRLPSERKAAKAKIEGGEPFAAHRRRERSKTEGLATVLRRAGESFAAIETTPQGVLLDLAMPVRFAARVSPDEWNAKRDAAETRMRDLRHRFRVSHFNADWPRRVAEKAVDEDPEANAGVWTDAVIIGIARIVDVATREQATA